MANFLQPEGDAKTYLETFQNQWDLAQEHFTGTNAEKAEIMMKKGEEIMKFGANTATRETILKEVSSLITQIEDSPVLGDLLRTKPNSDYVAKDLYLNGTG